MKPRGHESTTDRSDAQILRLLSLIKESRDTKEGRKWWNAIARELIDLPTVNNPQQKTFSLAMLRGLLIAGIVSLAYGSSPEDA